MFDADRGKICSSVQLLKHGFDSDEAAGASAGIATDMTVWEGIVVSPLEKAYEKPPERKEGEPGDELADDDDMDMADN